MKSHDEDFPELDEAVRAIVSHELPNGPSDELCASTVEALQAILVSNSKSSRREIMYRLAKYGTLGTAASITIAMVGSLIISGVTSQPALAQVAEKVRDAKSVTYKMSQKLGNQPAIVFDCSILGAKMRLESNGQQIIFVDTSKRKSTMLLPAQKLAITGDMQGDPKARSLNLAEVLAEITDENATLAETTKQDGKTLDVYDLSKLPSFLGQGSVGEGNLFRVWVDRQTELPTRVVLKLLKNSKAAPAEMEFDDFVWNPDLDPTSFDVNIPAGYTLKDAKDLQPK